MSINKQELVDYRISRSKETYDEALLLATQGHWNAVANRLYYSCYYMVNALLIKNDFNYSSHNGVKTEFHKSFVKPELVSKDSGKIYSRLFFICVRKVIILTFNDLIRMILSHLFKKLKNFSLKLKN